MKWRVYRRPLSIDTTCPYLPFPYTTFPIIFNLNIGLICVIIERICGTVPKYYYCFFPCLSLSNLLILCLPFPTLQQPCPPGPTLSYLAPNLTLFYLPLSSCFHCRLLPCPILPYVTLYYPTLPYLPIPSTTLHNLKPHCHTTTIPSIPSISLYYLSYHSQP